MQEIGATGLLEGTGGGGGGGTVDSVVAGAGISVDNTDPANPIVTNTASGGTPAGGDTEIQYNNAGAFGASSDLVFNDTTKVFKVMDGGDNLLLVSAAAGDYGLGDLDGIGNSTRLFIDDTIKAATIATGGDRIRLDLDGTAFTAKLGDADSLGNDTLLTVDDSNSVRTATSSGKEMVVGPLNSTHAPTSDPIAMGGTFTGVVTTTYTITVNTGTTFDWTDGTNSGTNVAMDFGSPNVLSQGVTVFFVGGSYTPTEYWTQTYTATVVSRLILDYKNKSYSIGNAGTSGARARIITDGTSNAKVGTYATNYTAEIRTDTSSVGFLYSNGTYSGGFGISGSQASFAISNSASDQSILDFRPTFALFYTQDGGSGYYAGVKTTTTSVKVGDFDLIANSTLLTVDDNAKKIKLALGTHSYFQLQNGGFGTDNVELFGGSTVGSILMANDDNIISFINNSNTWFYMDYPNKQFSLGDVSGGSNGTKIVVDDNAKKITVTKPLGLQGYTVATLPTGFTGAMAYVTDALAPAFGATVVGGGAVVMKVRYDGSNWIVG